MIKDTLVTQSVHNYKVVLHGKKNMKYSFGEYTYESVSHCISARNVESAIEQALIMEGWGFNDLDKVINHMIIGYVGEVLVHPKNG